MLTSCATCLINLNTFVSILISDLYCPQAAWLLRIVSCVDITTLAGDDTLANVERLCYKAKQPIRQHLMAAMGLEDLGQRVQWCCI